jgi:tetratricopeptide (TPR) repeat protein
MEQAFALAPEDPQVLGAYGLLERTDLENDAALDYFRRSLDANPSSGEVLNWQRMSQANAGLWEASLASADRMVEVDPMSKIALYNASASFVNTPYDDGERVEQLLDRLEGLDRSYGVAARGLVANYRGQVLEAIRQYFTVIELDPGRVSARDRLAGLLLELGLVEEAMQIDPRRDELDEAFARGEWEHGLALAQAQFEQDPDSFENLFDLLYVRVRSSDRFEDALPLVTASAAGMENAGIRFAPLYLTMARIAQLADAPAEARQLRDQGVELLQRQIDAGVSSTWVELSRLMLSVIDGDTESALQALEASMELGYRDRFLADNALLQPLWDDLQFQAEVARMNQLIEQERVQVAAMLCGPDRIVQSYQPAPETCALYPGS